MPLLSVRGNERYLKNMPVVGVTPSIYGFNNLGAVLNPYLNSFGANEIQFYSPFTGKVGPSFRPGNIFNDMRRGFENNPFYNVVSVQFPNLATEPAIKTLRYDNGKINLGVVGTETDLNVLKKILDDYYTRMGLAASADPVASPSAPVAGSSTTSGSVVAGTPGAAATPGGPALSVLPAPGLVGRMWSGITGLGSSAASAVSGAASSAASALGTLEGGQ